MTSRPISGKGRTQSNSCHKEREGKACQLSEDPQKVRKREVEFFRFTTGRIKHGRRVLWPTRMMNIKMKIEIQFIFEFSCSREEPKGRHKHLSSRGLVKRVRIGRNAGLKRSFPFSCGEIDCTLPPLLSWPQSVGREESWD